MQICPNCGRAFDGYHCLDCTARKDGIVKVFRICLPVAFGGIVVTPFATSLYPPLGPNSRIAYMIVLVALLVGFGLSIVYLASGERIIGFSRLVTLLIVSITAACLVPGSYFFLNGILDRKPALEVPSRVISKEDRSLGSYQTLALLLDLSWNQQTLEKQWSVDRKTYSEVEPGDSVRIILHPGAFSTPWYSSVDFGHNSGQERR